MKTSTIRRLPLRGRAVLGSVAVAVVAASMSGVGPAKGVGETPIPPVTASIVLPAWDDHGKHAGGAPAPLDQLKIRPGGEVAWGAVVSAGEETITGAQLELAGLPSGVSVRPGDVPASVDSGTSTRVGECTATENGIACPLENSVDSSTVIGLILSAKSDTQTGNYPVTMSLIGAGDVAPINADLKVQRGTDSYLTVNSSGDDMPRIGESQIRRIEIFNRGGGRTTGKRSQIKLKKVLPTDLVSKVSASGKGWKCQDSAKSCSWRGSTVEVGQRFPRLSVEYEIKKQAFRKGKRGDGNKTWVQSMSGTGFAKDRQGQLLYLMPKPAKQEQVTVEKRKPALHVTVVPLGEQQLGGTATYQLTVNNGGLAPAKRVWMDINIPKHTRITRIDSAKAVTCTKEGRCTFKRSIQASKALPPITLRVQSADRLRAGGTKNQQLSATVHWKHGGEKFRTKDVVEDPWAKPIKVRVTTTTPKLNPKVGDGLGSLQAVVTGTESFTYRWKQECPQKGQCHKVKWQGDTRGRFHDEDIVAHFYSPKVKKKHTLRFALHVNSGGADVVGRTKVKLAPFSLESDPRLKQSDPTKQVVDVPPMVDPGTYSGTRVKPVADIRVNGRGHTKATAGKKLTLRLKSAKERKGQKNQIKKARWSVKGSPADLFANAKLKNKGKVVKVKIPKGTPHAVVVRVKVIYPRGVVVNHSELITVKPNPETSLEGRATPGLGSGSSESENAAFCALYNKAKSTGLPSITIDGLVMTLGKVTLTGSACTDGSAAVTFTAAEVTINGVGLTEASGTITPQGLALKSAVFGTPSDPSVGKKLTSFAGSPAAGSGEPMLSAPFVNGELSGLSGTPVLGGFPYLPLPDGWKITQSTLSFSHSVEKGYGVKMSATATGPNQGSVDVAGSMDTKGDLSLSVKATNVWELIGKDGSVATFSGEGSISRTSGSNVKYDVTLTIDSQSGFELYGGVTMTDATVTWNNSGLNANADLVLVMGDKDANPTNYKFTVTGQIKGTTDWSLKVTGNFKIETRFIEISALSGTISMSKNPTTKKAELAMDLSAGITTWSWPMPVGFTLEDVKNPKAHVGIYCNNPPAGQSKPIECEKARLQLQVQLDATIAITEAGSDPWKIPIQTTANANILTGAIDIEGIIAPGFNFGPEWLNANDLTVFYTDDPQLNPSLKDNICLSDQAAITDKDAYYGVIGNTQVAGWGNGRFTGVYTKGGGASSGSQSAYCIASTYKPPQSGTGTGMGVMPDDVGYFKDEVAIVYSSYNTRVQFNQTWVDVKANHPTIIGMFQVGNYNDALKDFEAVIVTLGFTYAAPVDPDDPKKEPYKPKAFELTILDHPVDMYWKGDSNSKQNGESYARVSSLGGTISGDFSKSTWKFGAQVNVELYYPASKGSESQMTAVDAGGNVDGDNVGAQEMTVQGSVIFSFGQSPGVSLALLLRSGKQDPQGNWVVDDAFGISGLDIVELSVKATFQSLTKADFAVAATIMTPSSDNTSFIGNFTRDIGLQPDSSISFGMQWSDVDPCYFVRITGPKAGSPAISWGGLLQADDFLLYVAPNGCQIATDAGLKDFSGYAIDFDGVLLGVQMGINGYLTLTRPDPTKPSEVGWGSTGYFNAYATEFNYAGLSVTSAKDADSKADYVTEKCPEAPAKVPPKYGKKIGPTVNAKFQTGSLINTMAGDYLDVSFGGAINIWGLLKMKACGGFRLNEGPNQDQLQFDLNGSQDENLLGLFSEKMAFVFDADFSIKKIGPSAGVFSVDQMKVAATQSVDFLGIVKGGITAEFDYVKDGATGATYVNSFYFDLEAEVSVWILAVGAEVDVSYCQPLTGQVTCKHINGKESKGTDGEVVIEASGFVKYWFFGWHKKSKTFTSQHQIDMQKPADQPPPPAQMQATPPKDQWPEKPWGYGPQQFTGVQFNEQAIAKAAGVADTSGLVNPPLNDTNRPFQTPTVGYPYGAAARSWETTTSDQPILKYSDVAIVELGDDSGRTSTGPSAAKMAATVTLPRTPTYDFWLQGLPPRVQRQVATDPKYQLCAGGQTKDIEIEIPQWQMDGVGKPPADGSGGSVIVSEANWKLFLATVVEQKALNSAVTAGRPAGINDYECGYNDWDKFMSYNDFNQLTENDLPQNMNLAYPQAWPKNSVSMYCLKDLQSGSEFQKACQNNVGVNGQAGYINGWWQQGWADANSSPPPTPPQAPTKAK